VRRMLSLASQIVKNIETLHVSADLIRFSQYVSRPMGLVSARVRARQLHAIGARELEKIAIP
jgi:hypothetical protein